MGREVQRYLPDEYLYGQLARSLAEGHGFRILGMPNAMPALLQPLITAPAWMAGDPELAFRITEAINAVAMGLGAIVVFAIARAVGVRPWHAVAAAAVALASPDLVYAGYVTADSSGTSWLSPQCSQPFAHSQRPSLRAPSPIFLAAAALATFARLQYAALVIAVALAAAIVERGRPGALIRRHALLVAAPLAGAAVIIGRGRIGGYYESVLSFRISTGTVGWLPVSTVLLAVAAGIIIVPGAVVWTVSQIVKPTDQAASRVRSRRCAFTDAAPCRLGIVRKRDGFEPLLRTLLDDRDPSCRGRLLLLDRRGEAAARHLRCDRRIPRHRRRAGADQRVRGRAGNGRFPAPLSQSTDSRVRSTSGMRACSSHSPQRPVPSWRSQRPWVRSDGRRSRGNSRSADGRLGRCPRRRPAALGVHRLGRTTRRAGLGRPGRRQERPPGGALRERHAGGNAAGASQLLDRRNRSPRAARPAIRRGYAAAQRQ